MSLYFVLEPGQFVHFYAMTPILTGRMNDRLWHIEPLFSCKYAQSKGH